MVWQPNSQGRSRNVRTVMADTTVLAVIDGLFMKHSAHLGIHTELSILHQDLLTSAALRATLRLKASPLSRDPPRKCEEANPAPRPQRPCPLWGEAVLHFLLPCFVLELPCPVDSEPVYKLHLINLHSCVHTSSAWLSEMQSFQFLLSPMSMSECM